MITDDQIGLSFIPRSIERGPVEAILAAIYPWSSCNHSALN